jgi:hypothetical protein
MPIGARWTIIERERQVSNFIFRLLVHLFLSDKMMDTVDSQILDGDPPQRLIDPLYQNFGMERFHVFVEIVPIKTTESTNENHISKIKISPVNGLIFHCLNFLYHNVKTNQLRTLDEITRYPCKCLMCLSQSPLAIEKQYHRQSQHQSTENLYINLTKCCTWECWFKTDRVLWLIRWDH